MFDISTYFFSFFAFSLSSFFKFSSSSLEYFKASFKVIIYFPLFF
ncbi:hypothetical protein CSU_0342 [Campylobacter jejuni subsp. jejuni 327]|nr:hypothetical protein CJD42_4990 [Campylobacter jejuni subsp. jejuni D42a]EFV11139.1 hypothetical protein CSU_0342 [Campylobacter jejuni subsp. jejuni 327]